MGGGECIKMGQAALSVQFLEMQWGVKNTVTAMFSIYLVVKPDGPLFGILKGCIDSL